MEDAGKQKKILQSVFHKRMEPRNPVARKELGFGFIAAVTLVVGTNLYFKALVPSRGFTPETLVWLTILLPALIISLTNFVRPKGGLGTVDILRRMFWYLVPTTIPLAMPLIGQAIFGFLESLGDGAWPLGFPIYGIFIYYFNAFTMPYIVNLTVISYICALVTWVVSIKLNKPLGALLGFILAVATPVGFLNQIPLGVPSQQEIENEKQACLNAAENQDFIIEQAGIFIDPESFYLGELEVRRERNIKTQPLWGKAFMVWEGEEDIARMPLPGQLFASGWSSVIDKASSKRVGSISFAIKCDRNVPQIQAQSNCYNRSSEIEQAQAIWNPVIGFNTAKSFVSLLEQKRYDDAQEYLSKNQWNDEEAKTVVQELGEEIQTVSGVGLYERGGTESDPYFGKTELDTTEPDPYLGIIGPYENQDAETYYYLAKLLRRDGGKRILFMETACENFYPKISKTAVIED